MEGRKLGGVGREQEGIVPKGKQNPEESPTERLVGDEKREREGHLGRGL